MKIADKGAITILGGRVNLPVALTQCDSTVISSVIGTDICSARNRYVDIAVLERGLTPFNLYRSRIISSSTCTIVLSAPEDYVEILLSSIASKPAITAALESYISFLSSYMERLCDLLIKRAEASSREEQYQREQHEHEAH